MIHASLDKHDGNRVRYVSGAIENPEINKLLVNILEGTARRSTTGTGSTRQSEPACAAGSLCCEPHSFFGDGHREA